MDTPTKQKLEQLEAMIRDVHDGKNKQFAALHSQIQALADRVAALEPKKEPEDAKS